MENLSPQFQQRKNGKIGIKKQMEVSARISRFKSFPKGTPPSIPPSSAWWTPRELLGRTQSRSLTQDLFWPKSALAGSMTQR